MPQNAGFPMPAARQVDLQIVPPETRDELPDGTELLQGQYRIRSFLNAGGFGITYRAVDSLERPIVIKECFPGAFCRRVGTMVQPRLPSHREDLASIVRLFVQEARSLAKLQHPSIVGVHQVFSENDTAYMALDFIEGQDLLDLLEEGGSMPPERVVEVMRTMLDALGFVHAQGMLHRDVSPDNVLVRADGTPVLIDFGAARQRIGKQSRVLSALRVVKDGYSPQEFYVTGAEQGPFSDLYALGATLHHLIAGEAPPDSQSRLTAVATGAADPYEPLLGRVAGYRDAVLASVDRALAVVPKDRWQTAEEWREAMEKRGRVRTRVVTRVKSRPAPRAEAAPRRGRGPLLARVAALALLAGGGAFAVLSPAGNGGAEAEAEALALAPPAAAGAGSEAAEAGSEAARAAPEEVPAILSAAVPEAPGGDVGTPADPVETPAGALSGTAAEAPEPPEAALRTALRTAPETSPAPRARPGGAPAAAPAAAPDAPAPRVVQAAPEMALPEGAGRASPAPSGVPRLSPVASAPLPVPAPASAAASAPAPGLEAPPAPLPSGVEFASAWTVRLPLGDLRADPDGAMVIRTVQGAPVESLADFRAVLATVPKDDALRDVALDVGLGRPGGPAMIEQVLTLPVIQETRFGGGVVVQATAAPGGGWTSRVIVAGGRPGGLAPGDVLVADLTSGQRLDGRHALAAALERTDRRGDGTLTLMVRRNGEDLPVTVDLAARR
ncbi:serine/threonine protein kinase [Hasllibacter halocynthiae]|uniref:Serine/threonine protein kinase n=1 Tax=Hasllibacter halocynthiae TaxID=595589 RepID=A0A2T0WYY6_9RHOB|nr:serine/threonine-protein kinase [Hasllibacter halocynthiae]PRY91916.1 serine/threonine protein kinase [Hasllibacter halocynthiae]